jgi:hypothetical protein
MQKEWRKATKSFFLFLVPDGKLPGVEKLLLLQLTVVEPLLHLGQARLLLHRQTLRLLYAVKGTVQRDESGSFDIKERGGEVFRKNPLAAHPLRVL